MRIPRHGTSRHHSCGTCSVFHLAPRIGRAHHRPQLLEEGHIILHRWRQLYKEKKKLCGLRKCGHAWVSVGATVVLRALIMGAHTFPPPRVTSHVCHTQIKCPALTCCRHDSETTPARHISPRGRRVQGVCCRAGQQSVCWRSPGRSSTAAAASSAQFSRRSFGAADAEMRYMSAASNAACSCTAACCQSTWRGGSNT